MAHLIEDLEHLAGVASLDEGSSGVFEIKLFDGLGADELCLEALTRVKTRRAGHAVVESSRRRGRGLSTSVGFCLSVPSCGVVLDLCQSRLFCGLLGRSAVDTACEEGKEVEEDVEVFLDSISTVIEETGLADEGFVSKVCGRVDDDGAPQSIREDLELRVPSAILLAVLFQEVSEFRVGGWNHVETCAVVGQ